jgi:hypothetical protein
MPTTTGILAFSDFAGTDGKKTRHEKELVYTAGTTAPGQPVILDSSGDTTGPKAVVQCAGVSFTEDGSGTTYTGTVPVQAGTFVLDIQFRSTVLWDGTSAALDVGDDDDANGYFAAINLKATDLLVGEVLSLASSENWGGKQGVYLVAATGLKSATYYATANNIIGVVTPGAADGSAGRSFMHVFYATPVLTASTNV